MFVIVAYDVNTETAEGRKRLRTVSKICQNYGQRVQNSLFECCIQYGEYLMLKQKLKKVIDEEKDSLRYYNLGNKGDQKIEHVGTKASYDPQGTLII